MIHVVKLGQEAVEVDLRRSRRARSVRLGVHHDGRVVLTVPWRCPEFFAWDFLRRKSDWVLMKLEHFKTCGVIVLAPRPRGEYKKLKVSAFVFVKERLAHFNQIYGFRFGKISIRNQKTRWGSCSRKGNLSFNYKIVLLPPLCADYIVVHELCHTAEFNHGKKFWDLVARTVPEYKERRKELRKGGWRLG